MSTERREPPDYTPTKRVSPYLVKKYGREKAEALHFAHCIKRGFMRLNYEILESPSKQKQ